MWPPVIASISILRLIEVPLIGFQRKSSPPGGMACEFVGSAGGDWRVDENHSMAGIIIIRAPIKEEE